MHDDFTSSMIIASLSIACVTSMWFIIGSFSVHAKIQRETELNTTTNLMHAIRRHTSKYATYRTLVDNATTIVLQDVARVDSTHWALENTPWAESAHPVDAPALGRHHLENPYRVIVADDWYPIIGETRIAILDTPTSEYRAIMTRQPQSKQLVW